MGYKIYTLDSVCPKCGFPCTQMMKRFFDEPHNLIEDNAVIKCKIKKEHIHMQCMCGYEIITRPMDWKNDTNKTTRNRETQENPDS